MIKICRLALFNKKGMELIEKKYGLEKFLDRLEKECGGHGNGLALTNGKGYMLKKGMNFTNKEIVNILLNTEYTYALYHTRVASIGVKKDSNCHPYREGNTILAMNGTERDFKVQADMLDITDTEAVLKIIVALKMPLVTTLTQLNSVYMGFDKGNPYVVVGKYKTNIRITKDNDGAIVFASSLPKEFDIYEPSAFPFIWKGGFDTILNKTIKKEVPRQEYHHANRHWWNSTPTDNKKSYNEKIWREVSKESDLDLD